MANGQYWDEFQKPINGITVKSSQQETEQLENLGETLTV